MTTVQELLGAEHVARVGDPVHAVQDVDLEREGLVGTLLPRSSSISLKPSHSPCPTAAASHLPPRPGALPATISIPTTYGFQSTPPRLLARGG